MRAYRELESLRGLYLEDSYVLEVKAKPGEFSMELELVLTPEHPDHRPPGPDEQHAYRRGTLTFTGVTELSWSGQGAPPAHDATGEEDHGTVDALAFEDDRYRAEGDFGLIEITATGISVTLSEAPHPEEGR